MLRQGARSRVLAHPIPVFTEDFTRSNRSLNGDNGWVVQAPGGSATFSIVSNVAKLTAISGVTYPDVARLLHPGGSHSMQVTDARSSTSGRSGIILGADTGVSTSGLICVFDSSTFFNVFLMSQYPSGSLISNDGTYGGTPSSWTGGSAVLAMVYDSATNKVTVSKNGTPFFRGSASPTMGTYAGVAVHDFGAGVDSFSAYSST